MNKPLFAVAILALSFSICLGQSADTKPSSSSSSASGIEGTVVLSPAHPGPTRIGVPNSRPLANVKFVVHKQGEEKEVASFTTDEQGHFRVSLPPGHYVVAKEGGRRGIGSFGPFEVEVPAGKMTSVEWRCDSGMR